MVHWKCVNVCKQAACRDPKADARLQKKVRYRVAPRRDCGEFMRRWCQLVALISIGTFIAGCPKGKDDYSAAKKAVDLQDYDAAVDYYLKA